MESIMDKKEYIFKYENKANWKGQRAAIGTALQILIDTKKEDFKITIEPHKTERVLVEDSQPKYTNLTHGYGFNISK
tara:strand:- start:151 stop:381 length:231 start_codon:yes stop_codon:yes gene_type:complete